MVARLCQKVFRLSVLGGEGLGLVQASAFQQPGFVAPAGVPVVGGAFQGCRRLSRSGLRRAARRPVPRHWRSRLSSATSTTTSPSRVSLTISRFSTIAWMSGWLAEGKLSQGASRRIGSSLSRLIVASHGMNASCRVSSWAWRCSGSRPAACRSRSARSGPSRPSTRTRPTSDRRRRRSRGKAAAASTPAAAAHRPLRRCRQQPLHQRRFDVSRRPAAVARRAGPVMTSVYPAGGMGLSWSNSSVSTPASSGAICSGS